MAESTTLDRVQTADLVQRSLDGDERAFKRLVEAHESRVYGVAVRLLGDPVAAQEAASEAFVRLYRSLGSLRGEARLSTWLHRVTVNLCRDEHRRLKRAERYTDLDSAGPRLVVIERAAEEALEVAEMNDRVRAALDELPKEQREAIVLRYLSELSYSEISEATGASANTVASRVYRGLRRLGALLGSDNGEREEAS
ncbi:MAG: RNA polymerase sigma factor [Gemmatimonadota bacterium]|nr:RNA polymerase sigma factor [Gemmatimonadota bacterium]